MYNPEKNAPRKIDIEKIQHTLSRKQKDKIKYECDLLRKSVEELVYLAPFLFCENTTAANTQVIEEPEEEEYTPNPYASYYYP